MTGIEQGFLNKRAADIRRIGACVRQRNDRKAQRLNFRRDSCFVIFETRFGHEDSSCLAKEWRHSSGMFNRNANGVRARDLGIVVKQKNRPT
jgi:hypothetical protein